jgi:hypothetical protein
MFAERMKSCFSLGKHGIRNCAIFFSEAGPNVCGKLKIVDLDEFGTFEAAKGSFPCEHMTIGPRGIDFAIHCRNCARGLSESRVEFSAIDDIEAIIDSECCFCCREPDVEIGRMKPCESDSLC